MFLALTLSGIGNSLAAITLRIFLAVNVGTALVGLYSRSELGPVGREISQVIQFVEANVPQNGSFFAVSTHPFPGFPPALYAGRHWQSVSNSNIFLPSVVRLTAQGNEPDDKDLAYSRAKSVEAVLRDLNRKPDLVLIDIRPHRHAINNDPFDFMAFYLSDPEIRSIWENYRKTDQAPDGFAAYERIKRTQ